MHRKGRSVRLMAAYKQAFEESFVDNTKGWQSTLDDINRSVAAIGKKHKKKFKPYSYDDFCCLAKLIIDERLERTDWDKIIRDEEVRSATEKAPERQRDRRIRRHMALLEREILFQCFEQAMMNAIGKRLYKKFKAEIEQFKEDEVTI